MDSLHVSSQDAPPDPLQPVRHDAAQEFVSRRVVYVLSAIVGIVLAVSLFSPWTQTDKIGCFFTQASGTCYIEKYKISPSAGPYSLFDLTFNQLDLQQMTVHQEQGESQTSEFTYDITFPDGEKNHILRIPSFIFWGTLLCDLLLVVLPIAWLIKRRVQPWDYTWICGLLLGSLVFDAIFVFALVDPFNGVSEVIVSHTLVRTVLTLPYSFGFWLASFGASTAFIMVMLFHRWEIRYPMSSVATTPGLSWRLISYMTGFLLVVMLFDLGAHTLYTSIDEATQPHPTATSTPAPLRATCFTLSLQAPDADATTCDTAPPVTMVPLNTTYYLTACYQTDVPLPSAVGINIHLDASNGSSSSLQEITPEKFCFMDSGDFAQAGTYTAKLYWHPPPIEHFPHLPDAPETTDPLWQLQMQIQFTVI